MALAIKVENLSKAYRLGEIGTGTMSRDFERWLAKVRGKEDPFLKIGETNDRADKGKSDIVWSLKDINFQIKEGEAVGIIGRNGAGKSTLLKLLSRVTSPTTGNFRVKGRIASLLEVGTGFHPDLTGRDNVYLNGAILGMRKNEIKRKFDEIVSFSGVERYIDTPVKRYSSGMYVRLAFAVAAHLESEILVVDEVLAVGDAEFQRKCLGKMGEVSKGEGRTVLFVSHNMEAILKLCPLSIYLKNGELIEYGKTSNIINSYLKSEIILKEVLALETVKRSESLQLKGNAKYINLRLVRYDTQPWKLKYKQTLTFQCKFLTNKDLKFLELGISISTINEFEILSSLTSDYEKILNTKKGIHEIDVTFDDLHLLPGAYKVGLGMRSEYDFEDYLPLIAEFEILISDASFHDKSATRNGCLVPKISYVLKRQNTLLPGLHNLDA